MVNVGNSAPGIRSDRTFTPRPILWSRGGEAPPAEYLPTAVPIDATYSRDALNTGDLSTLRPGIVMGLVTSTKMFAPSIIGVTTAAAASAATAITVSAATATELSRRIGGSGTFNFTGPPTAAGTVATLSVSYSAINTTTGVITATAITAAMVTGSLVRPADGSQTPLAILDEHVRVTDADGNNVNGQSGRMLIGGAIQAAQIINYPADASSRAWLKDQLNQPKSGPGPFKFDDNFVL